MVSLFFSHLLFHIKSEKLYEYSIGDNKSCCFPLTLLDG